MGEFWTFALVGFIAQLADGALGMGFGVISAAVLLGQGYAPALVSASINAAKIPTSGTAALSHWLNGNVDRSIAFGLVGFGALGGITGMLLLTSLEGPALRALVSAYLIAIGLLIVRRALRAAPPRLLSRIRFRLIGLLGGLIEGIGGSWGPIVTTGLLGSGAEPRLAIGSSTVAELFVSAVVLAAYLTALASGHWDGEGWRGMIWPLAGLIAGALPAAVLGGWLPRMAPRPVLAVAVGLLAISVGLYRIMGG